MPDPKPPSDGEAPTQSEGAGSSGTSEPQKRLGDFDLLREIGRGGMGVVYEARQISLNRRVALKVLPPGLGLTAQAVQRFEREAHAAAKLHHTNIVPVHATGKDDGCHYYAMELIEGQPLSDVLRDLSSAGSNPLMERTVTQLNGGERTSESNPDASHTTSGITSLSDTQSGGRKWFDAVANLIAEVAEALEYAHGRGVIHRDIKPANLMLSNDGKLCVTDFGLARVAQEPGMTVSGSLMGTPAYMSPEQIASGRMKLDHRTDIYSLGAVLYEILTHQRPFPGDNREEILGGILTKDPRPPRRFNPRVPLDLETIALKAMEKDPDRRYTTAGEMANDLRQYLHGGLITARRASLPRRAWKSMRRHPAVTISIAAVLVVGLLVGFGWRALRQADAPRLLAEANLMLERGDHQAGLEAVERALALQPGLPEARIVRARLLLQLVRPDEVIAEARALLADNPDDWVAHYLLAFVSKQGYGPDIPATEHLAAVERLAPESADVFFLRGRLAKSASEAVELYTRALELNPAHTWALLKRAGGYADLKNFGAAKADAERMLAIRPRSPRGRRMLGMHYKDLLDYDRSLEEYAKAIEIDPRDPWNYGERGWVYVAMGRDEEAIADFTRAIEIGPAHSAFYQYRANAYFRLERNEDALADARRALELNPDNRWAFYRFLDVYLRTGRMDEFERTADELRARAAGWFDPEARADAFQALSWTYQRMGEHEQALVEADRAVEADPGHLWSRIQRINVLRDLNDEAGFESECDAIAGLAILDPGPLGVRARQLGSTCLRWDQSAEHLGLLIEDYPDWSVPYFDRGVAHYYLGRYEESIADLTQTIELSPRNGMAYGNRGIVYGTLHRYEEQLADYEKALELNPRNPTQLSNSAVAALKLGQTEEAFRFLDRAIELDPLYVWPRAGRSTILAALGRCPEALDELEAIEDLLDRTTRYIVALVHADFLSLNCPNGYDPVEALAYARESFEAQPEERQVVVALGSALYRNGRYREAREAFLKADSMSSAGAAELFYLAMSAWQLGEKQQARSYHDQGLAWMNRYTPKNVLLIPLREEVSLLLGIEP